MLDSLRRPREDNGHEVVAACPEGYDPASGNLTLVRDPREAARDADVLVTDIWVSLGQEATRAERVRDLEPYRLDESLPSCLTGSDRPALPRNTREEIDARGALRRAVGGVGRSREPPARAEGAARAAARLIRSRRVPP